MVELSVLDLVPVRQGSTPGGALKESAALAQYVEQFGLVGATSPGAKG